MGINNSITYRSTVAVAGNISYSLCATLRQRNCYVAPCYAATLEAKRGIMFATLKDKK